MQTPFEDSFIPEPNSGCWLWLGQVNQHGYGRTRLANGRSQVAHRAMYEAYHNTTVPAEMQVDHLCFLRCCVNPDHLEVVTPAENTRRSFRRRNGYAASGDQFCSAGHEMTDANRRVRKNGNGFSVICRACAKAANAKHRKPAA